jgi:hypothetical protein
MTQFVIRKLSPINDDGSQDIWVEGSPKPFHVTAEWLKAQPHGVEIGDTLTFTGTTLSVDPAQPAEAQPMTEPTQGPPVKQAPPAPAADDTAQKKTDGGEGLEVGSRLFQPNYRANPVEVEASEIVSVAGAMNADGSLNLALANGSNVIAHPDMLSRITPAVGDYWVVQADGYVYLNPKAVFERKYSPISG